METEISAAGWAMWLGKDFTLLYFYEISKGLQESCARCATILADHRRIVGYIMLYSANRVRSKHGQMDGCTG